MFSSNDTPAEEYAYAAKLGAIINLDDITHIPFLEEILGGKFPETMSLRYNPGGVFRMSNGIMDNPGDSKYGMTEKQLFEAFRILKEKGVDCEYYYYNTFFFPKGTDKAIVDKFAKACQNVIENNPDYAKDLEGFMQPKVYLGPEETAKYYSDELAHLMKYQADFQAK